MYHSEKASLGCDAVSKSATQEQIPSRADGVGQAEVVTPVETVKCELEEPGEGIDSVQATRFTPPLTPTLSHLCVRTPSQTPGPLLLLGPSGFASSDITDRM